MISRHHLIGWSRSGCARVVAIVDPDRERASSRAAEFDIPRIYASAEEMLAKEALDAVDVASPRETHAGIVRGCAQRGVHAFCQKPLAPTLTEAEGLVADVAGKIRLMVHENWRFRPYYRQVKTWLSEGHVGKVNGCRLVCRSSGFLPDAEGHRQAFVRQPFMQHEKYLMIREVLIHHIDVVRWFAGPLKLVSALAAATLADVKGETYATILMETPSRAPIVVDGNMAVPGYPARTADELELIGDRSTIRFSGNRLELLGATSVEKIYDLDSAYQKSFDDTILHFCQCMLSGEEFETSGQDNLETLRLVEDAERAAGLR